MNWIKGGVVAAVLAVALPATGLADWNGPRGKAHGYFGGLRRPQHGYHQKHDFGRRGGPGWGNEIQRGIMSGRLSRAEVSELTERQREIARKRQAYLSDGHLSSREREKLRKEMDAYRKKLAHELSDGERRHR